jgi:hypothetical protein
VSPNHPSSPSCSLPASAVCSGGVGNRLAGDLFLEYGLLKNELVGRDQAREEMKEAMREWEKIKKPMVY